jgi:hypothetical protein
VALAAAIEIYPACSDLQNCNNLYPHPEIALIYCRSGTISHACSDLIFGSDWLCICPDIWLFF